MDNSIVEWRRRSWIEFVICITIMVGIISWFLYRCHRSFEEANTVYKTEKENILSVFLIFLTNCLFTSWVVKSLVDKYRNHSNIKAYLERLKIPDEYKDLSNVDQLS